MLGGFVLSVMDWVCGEFVGTVQPDARIEDILYIVYEAVCVGVGT